MKSYIKVVCEKGCESFIQIVRGVYAGSGYDFCGKCESSIVKIGA